MTVIEVRRHWFVNSLNGREEIDEGSPYFIVSTGVASEANPQYDNGLGVLVGFADALQFPLVWRTDEEVWYAKYELPDILIGTKFTIRAFHPDRPGRVLSEEHFITTDDVFDDIPADVEPGGSFPQQP